MEPKKMLKNAAALVGAAGLSAGAAAAAKRMKEKGICPFCEVKRLANKIRLDQTAETAYGNGAAQTPPMGWSSWNLFATHINEKLILEIADAMEKSGLAEAGYRYVNLDDCWQSSERGADGCLQCDKAMFPGGIPALAKAINQKGLKLGIYSSNGSKTCEDYPASLRHEALDAETFASWGVEYLKYDFCHNVPISEKAPRVCGIELSRPGESVFAAFSPEDVICKGKARLVRDEKGSGFLTGLSSRGGSFSLNLQAQEDCEMILTLIVKKEMDAERFLRLTINGKEEYHLYAAKSRGPQNGERRVQTPIRLQKGMNTLAFDNPVGSRFDSAAIQYKLMGRELRKASAALAERTGEAEKPIVFSICEWGFNRPWKWGREAGNLWRTTGDIKPVWSSILAIYEFNVRLWRYAAPGAWNDPDMLEVGNGKLTENENRAHFSLWCMMAAPLILGNDVRTFVLPDGTADKTNKYLKILTNRAMIAVDQDPLGIQGRRIKTGLTDVLVKPLTGARAAVCVFNKTNKAVSVPLDLKKIANEPFVQVPQKDSYRVRDVWEELEFEGIASLCAEVPAHGVKVYIME